MSFSRFIGREEEMARLKSLLSSRSASLVVVRGRRRIGKSRLLAEFGKEIRSLYFSGIPPTQKTSAKAQRDEFSYQLERVGLPGIKADDWGNLFWHLSKYTTEGRVLIVLDEISWMGGKDPNFLGKLKTAWDMYFSKNPQLILALCGSISSWIEENILSSTGFVGRVAIDLVVEELPLNVCNAFWYPKEKRIAAYEKFKLLAVTGGIPLYLERTNPDWTAEQNIRELCFTRGGLLVREFDEIFSDLFSRKNVTYKEIILSITEGSKNLVQICKSTNKHLTGAYSKHLEDLVESGFLKRDFTWNLSNGEEGKLSKYRLSDNYIRFYLKYIEPNITKIEKGDFSQTNLSQLPGWETITSLQFENLVTHSRRTIWKLLNLSPEEVMMDGPFFQNHTLKQPGCQIDYMIQTRFNNIFLCEIKFSKNPITKKIIQEMEEKRERLKIPKFCSIRQVLIHVNGVHQSVVDERYFDKIIDFGQLLE